MKLSDYRKTYNKTQQDIASLLGISPAAVCRYENGRVPKQKHLEDISKITNGKVQPNDFFDLDPTNQTKH